MDTVRAGSAPDMLTRTTLRFDAAVSMLSALEIKRALQKVPGVLLAEIDATGTRAMVAHDSAVPMASLLAAISSNGARATVLGEPRARTVRQGVARPLTALPTGQLLLVAAVVLLLPLIGTISPSLAKSHLLIPIVICCVWAFVVARAVFRHRM